MEYENGIILCVQYCVKVQVPNEMKLMMFYNLLVGKIG